MSTFVIFACAKGLRSTAMCSIPGSLMLSVQLALPVTRAGSSLRGTPPPTYFSGVSVTPMPLFRLAGLSSGLLDGLDDVLVARAATVVALEPLADLLLRRVRVLLKQAHRSHDHARRAIPALQPVLLVERRLHGMPTAVLRETLDRRDLTPIGLHREHRARLDRLTVHEHRARPAVGRVAPDHGPRQVQLLAQEMHKQHPGLDLAL